MAILTVGAGQQFATISAAVAASHDGDVLQVKAGTYYNDFSVINTKITIEGVGGQVNLVATVRPPNGKAILVTNNDVTLDNISFTGTKVPDGNGAGIRYQAGNLVINNCYFYDNQDGLLAADNPSGTITINNSEFAHNGTGDGYTHNLYVGTIANLTIDNSYFHDAVVGHEIKSRAMTTTIQNSRIFDGPTGTASYSIDLPAGGNAIITDNVIEQGPKSQNPAIIHFGGSGTLLAGSALQISNNTILNDLNSPSSRALLNTSSVVASFANNQLWGLTAGQIATGPVSASGTTWLASEPALDTSSPWLPVLNPGSVVAGVTPETTLSAPSLLAAANPTSAGASSAALPSSANVSYAALFAPASGASASAPALAQPQPSVGVSYAVLAADTAGGWPAVHTADGGGGQS